MALSVKQFNTNYEKILSAKTAEEFSSGMQKILGDLVDFDRANADGNGGEYDTGLSFYNLESTHHTDASRSLYSLATITNDDIEKYVAYLKDLDTTGKAASTGHDDEVTAEDLINLINGMRYYAINNYLNHENSNILTVENLNSVFDGGLTSKAEKEKVKAAVTAFDQLDDPNDGKVTTRDLRAFAQSYGLSGSDITELRKLY